MTFAAVTFFYKKLMVGRRFSFFCSCCNQAVLLKNRAAKYYHIKMPKNLLLPIKSQNFPMSLKPHLRSAIHQLFKHLLTYVPKTESFTKMLLKMISKQVLIMS
jgi:hypothetical protein